MKAKSDIKTKNERRFSYVGGGTLATQPHSL